MTTTDHHATTTTDEPPPSRRRLQRERDVCRGARPQPRARRPHRRARGRRPDALPHAHRRPPDRPAAHRPLPRQPAQPGPPAGQGRRDLRRHRRLPGHHRPRRRSATSATNVQGLVLDYLAAGLDPARTTIFTHSAVPALNQLMLPFLSLVTDAELRRNPTVKDELRALGRAPAVRAAAHLPRAPGGRHPLLPQPDRAGRPGPAAAPRADPGHRAPLQPAVCRWAQCVPRAGGPAQRGPAAARHRRHEDEQEPRQRRSTCATRRTRPRPGSAWPAPTPSDASPTTPTAGPRSPTS